MTAGRDFYYEGGGRRAALDELFEAICPAAVVCVVGEAGSGRTALVARFCQEADPDVLAVAVVTGDILMSGEQCLQAAAGAFRPDELADPQQAVERVQAGGRMPVLIVDDAHELGEQPRVEVVRFCRERGVALVLVGDGVLVDEPERTHGPILLRTFTEEESEDFIAAWLAVGDEDELPSHRTVERLHRQCGGMPGRLAVLLAAGAAARNTWFPAGFPLWHVVFSVAAVGLLLVLLAWLAPQDVRKTASLAGQEVEVPLPAPHEVAAAGQDAAAPATRLSSVAVPRPVEIAPLPVTEVVPSPVPAPEKAIETPVALPPPPPVAAPRVAAGKPVALRRYTADEDSLLKEKASRYTLQLFASFNEQAVRQFEAAHAGTEIRVFRTVREELPWHVAVTGSYRSKDEAKAAVAKLQPDLRKLEPWARSFQGIQDELRRRKD